MLIGLDKYKSMLLDKIPNIKSSIIVSGNNGIGKFSLVLEVISELVSNDANVHVIKPEEGKTQISVEQIRDLFPIINIKPFDDSQHYVIIDDADKLNDVSFNLLLKRLEEPKSTELFILVTSNMDVIASTIKSRCLNINITLDYNEMQSYISKVEDPDIQIVLNKLGFAYVISYVNSDAVKSRYADAKKLASEIANLTSRKQIANYSARLLKDLNINMEMLMSLYDNDIFRNAYNMISKGIVNKQIVIEVMLYSIIEQNTVK